jgi:hypothetical protein
MVSAKVIAIIAIVAVVATSAGSYYFAATPLSAIVSSYQTSITSYESVVSSFSAHPSTTTIFSTMTQTTTSTSVTTSTKTYYPVPSNITVLFDSSGSFLSYRIDTPFNGWGGQTFANSFSQDITPIYNNEWISVQASCSSSCSNRTNFSALLLVNDYPVAVASGNSYTALLINYTI